MFFIKKQFKDIISWGIVSFCFFGGFSLFFYSFFIIYPLDEISKTEIENENIDLIISPDVNVITKPLNNVKINVVTEKELRENEIKKQEEAKTKAMEIKKQEEAKTKAMEIKKQEEAKAKTKAIEIKKRQELKIDTKVKAEIGIASWYCPKWCEKLAAAHSKYSKGTTLKVTNLENKKSVIIIVNDFGPNKLIHPRRIIDLTKTAFQKIANPGQGTVRVMVEKMIK
jgi:rare lipoprotein A (peptidoglycan hydrolase)